jgi:hypothetical protein
MAEIVLSPTDVKQLAQLTVLVMPILALSYLVADTDKFKVSTLLKSRITQRFKEIRNPEIYDAILPLLFCAAAIYGFSLGLFVVTAQTVQVWQLVILYVTLGACGLIIIIQVILSIVVPTLETILERRDGSTAQGAIGSAGNIIFIVAMAAAILTLIFVVGNLGYLIYQSTQTTIG